ncbi:GNAT family N-acetyltransferase [Escherichia coli]
MTIIEHTDVDESLKGQGIGKRLVAKVVEKMRREKRKIIPLCPFAKHEFDKTVTNGAIVIHTQRLKSDPGGNLLS